VASDDMHATFMAWEIALAIRRGAEMAGIDEAALKGVFFQNGMNVLNRVRKGQPVKALQSAWKTAPKFE
jgi:phosphotransferase system IIA component